MHRLVLTALVTSMLSVPALAEPLSLFPIAHPNPPSASALPPDDALPMRMASVQRPFGGGIIEFLFGGITPDYATPPRMRAEPPYPAEPSYVRVPDYGQPGDPADPAHSVVDPKYERQMVAYDGMEPAGTIIIDTLQRFLYLVHGNGKATRYGIGVGRPGFSWAGVKHISAKREWPDWRPPDDMLRRRPDLPHYMAGGPQNPLGARAMYLGSSLYRIHGSNEPWTIGQAVSSGCIRMRNEDVMDLYERVRVGTKVVVL
jgi:lipoprotein-anchoring transpeptidase ErfK/SrfK